MKIGKRSSVWEDLFVYLSLPIKILTVLVSFFLSTNLYSANPVIEMKTSKGIVEVELYLDKAPKTVANFLSYVDEKFYDGTIFHRVISDFMIQGGGLTVDLMKKKTKPPIENEASNGLSNEVGTIAMARTGDPHSATSQFFINVENNSRLDFRAKNAAGWGYCVFGKVVKGMSIVNQIKMVKTTRNNGRADVPVTPVLIEHIKRKK